MVPYYRRQDDVASGIKDEDQIRDQLGDEESQSYEVAGTVAMENVVTVATVKTISSLAELKS